MESALSTEPARAGGLSEAERVADIFVAPSKTFADILRSARWWLPFLILVIASLANTAVVDKQVGFPRVAENQVHQNPKQEEQMEAMKPEARAEQFRKMGVGYRYSSYAGFVFILAFVAIAALLYWLTLNFGMGSRTTYGQIFAMCMYASLPRALMVVLSIVTLLFGGNAESYDLRNPVGTNPAYYMSDGSPVVKAALSFFDVFGIWQLILLVIGASIIAKVSRGKAAAVVVGWWFVGLLVSVGIAAATS